MYWRLTFLSIVYSNYFPLMFRVGVTGIEPDQPLAFRTSVLPTYTNRPYLHVLHVEHSLLSCMQNDSNLPACGVLLRCQRTPTDNAIPFPLDHWHFVMAPGRSWWRPELPFLNCNLPNPMRIIMRLSVNSGDLYLLFMPNAHYNAHFKEAPEGVEPHTNWFAISLPAFGISVLMPNYNEYGRPNIHALCHANCVPAYDHLSICHCDQTLCPATSPINYNVCILYKTCGWAKCFREPSNAVSVSCNIHS